MISYVLVRGGGDLASGVVLRLHRAGMRVLVTELPRPLVIRRAVSFAQAVFAGECRVEEVEGRLVQDPTRLGEIWDAAAVPVLVDPEAAVLGSHPPLVLVDARMLKRPPETGTETAPLVIGLGPGFTAERDCHAVVETQRGHQLGRVLWQGSAAADSGIPDPVAGRDTGRLLRAPDSGTFTPHVEIGTLLKEGDLVASVENAALLAPFDGLLRGLLHSGLQVQAGQKVGDIDPRAGAVDWRLVSDKALAVGGGVLEAVLLQAHIREKLWLSR